MKNQVRRGEEWKEDRDKPITTRQESDLLSSNHTHTHTHTHTQTEPHTHTLSHTLIQFS